MELIEHFPKKLVSNEVRKGVIHLETLGGEIEFYHMGTERTHVLPTEKL